MVLSAFAVWGTISGGGPFVHGSINESLLLLTAFMISISVPSLALSADVAVRKRHQDHVDFVMHELSHRSKNLLAIVQSMANQVARQTGSFEDFKAGFTSRLQAFSDTHDLLIGGEWTGANMRDLVRTHLAPFHGVNDGLVHADGPELKLGPKAAEQIGMALHELATNAAKHGAFSGQAGTVWIRWDCVAGDDQGEHLRLVWKETGGPSVAQPKRDGFGMLVITKIVPAALGGHASLEFERHGIIWMLQVPLANIA
jgi:two-component sensor histidine kinase